MEPTYQHRVSSVARGKIILIVQPPQLLLIIIIAF